MKVPKLSPVASVVAFLLLMMALELWVFFSGFQNTSLDNQRTSVQVPVSYDGDTPLEDRDIARGIIAIESDPYFSLSGAQREKIIAGFAASQKLHEELGAETEELESLLTPEQIQYIQYNRWSSTGPPAMSSRELVEEALKKLRQEGSDLKSPSPGKGF